MQHDEGRPSPDGEYVSICAVWHDGTEQLLLFDQQVIRTLVKVMLADLKHEDVQDSLETLVRCRHNRELDRLTEKILGIRHGRNYAVRPLGPPASTLDAGTLLLVGTSWEESLPGVDEGSLTQRDMLLTAGATPEAAKAGLVVTLPVPDDISSLIHDDHEGQA